MKIRVVISGSRVHDVGYRVFLLNKALSEGLDGFSATNSYGVDSIQQVVVLGEGSDELVNNFLQIIQDEYPPHAMGNRNVMLNLSMSS
jgi:acylphosphatase